ncbi:MOSC domain-containing protein [Paenibacillus agricola]|uniref:MOSC domain-containing protein n=1 Tax=Paenibacillus agricola TaxID=2716264 RepID=A0ABX0IZK7_9BACL|nr:MOSC domain-containing protein [Paenibacillus agricola]NHN29422.1 MOSC domain-containing protein [Paenibacillus agricola]
MIKRFEARVEAVLMTPDPAFFITGRVEELTVDLGGIPNDRHYGLLRPADVRQKFYPRGKLIANRRQLSIVSVEECELVAQLLGIEHVLPEWLGANILVSGFPKLTMLPMGARLLSGSGAGLICEGENKPCSGPAILIAKECANPALQAKFVRSAAKRRGIVCSVECPGDIRQGDTLAIVIADA